MTKQTKEEIDSFLKSQDTMRLATVSYLQSLSAQNDTIIQNSITPHVVPVWYLYKDDKFYIGTSRKTTKAKNISQTNYAAFCIDAGVHSPDIFGVAGHGKAELIITENIVCTLATEILLRYYDSMDNLAAQKLLAETDCVIIITPKKMTSWSY